MPNQSLEEKLRQLPDYLNKEAYIKAVMQQIEKDFALCGLEGNFGNDYQSFFENLHQKVETLFTNHPNEMKNLLYRIDVDIRRISGQETISTEIITREIIMRTLQKIVIRKHFESEG